jgi:hypothetical protein
MSAFETHFVTVYTIATCPCEVKDTNRNVGGDHVGDGNGTVEFVSALLYDTMYSRDVYGNPLEEDTGKDYTNE